MAAGVAAMAVNTLLEDTADQRQAAMEKAKEASAVAAATAAAAATQAQNFLQDDKRKEVLASAGTKLSSLWGFVKSTAAQVQETGKAMQEEFNTPLPTRPAPGGYAKAASQVGAK